MENFLFPIISAVFLHFVFVLFFIVSLSYSLRQLSEVIFVDYTSGTMHQICRLLLWVTEVLNTGRGLEPNIQSAWLCLDCFCERWHWLSLVISFSFWEWKIVTADALYKNTSTCLDSSNGVGSGSNYIICISAWMVEFDVMNNACFMCICTILCECAFLEPVWPLPPPPPLHPPAFVCACLDVSSHLFSPGSWLVYPTAQMWHGYHNRHSIKCASMALPHATEQLSALCCSWLKVLNRVYTGCGQLEQKSLM